MPASIESTSEKSDTTQGNSVPFGQPHARFLVALHRFLSLLACQRLGFGFRAASVAVMRFIVGHDDVLLTDEITAHPADDLIGCFEERAGLGLRENQLRQPGAISARGPGRRGNW